MNGALAGLGQLQPSSSSRGGWLQLLPLHALQERGSTFPPPNAIPLDEALGSDCPTIQPSSPSRRMVQAAK